MHIILIINEVGDNLPNCIEKQTNNSLLKLTITECTYTKKLFKNQLEIS